MPETKQKMRPAERAKRLRRMAMQPGVSPETRKKALKIAAQGNRLDAMMRRRDAAKANADPAPR